MKLQDYLKKHGLTHEAFSKKVGVTRVQITRIITKTVSPSAALMRKIKNATLGEVDYKDLIEIELNTRKNKKLKRLER